ncbi:MAG: hypothetical protein AABY86_01540, partial [Bdellovibrionota bacterium]
YQRHHLPALWSLAQTLASQLAGIGPRKGIAVLDYFMVTARALKVGVLSGGERQCQRRDLGIE